MPTGPTGATSPGRVGVWPHQREPRKFNGTIEEDAEDWLKHYQRVSKYNRWDAREQLENVVFSLDLTALMWYDNHEHRFDTWDSFVNEFRASFGDTAARKKKAEQTLAQRAQVPGETCTTYIEEVLKLCSLVNPSMPDEDKVGHLLKGIAEDVYNYLITKENLASALDVIRHCRAFETLKMRRITPKFGRLANVTTVASVDVGSSPSEDIASVVRRIIREELAQQGLCRDQSFHQCALPDPVFRQCTVQAVQSHSEVPWVRAGNRNERTAYNEDHTRRTAFSPPPREYENYFEEPIRYAPVGYSRTRRSLGQPVAFREQRTCFNCGIRGHISRFCRRPPQHYEPPPRRPYTDNQTNAPFQRSFQPTAMRNNSPCSDRSFTPPPTTRRPRSPTPRRRMSSPPEGN